MSRLRLHRLLLPLLAVLGLLIAPLAAPAMTSATQVAGAMAAMSDAGAEMPCCPPEKPALPDCHKGCPLASICLAKCFHAAAGTETTTVGFDVVARLRPGNDARAEATGPSPQPRPPRT